MLPLLQEIYRELRPRAPIPEFDLQFYPFVNINNTIRLSQGRMKLRLSDLLEGAPEPVLRAIVHILLAKIYRKPIDAGTASRYRRYVASHDMMEKAQQLRQIRGRKRLESAREVYYDLDEVFDTLNVRFFHGLLGRPQMSWSGERARHLLGHYDPAHNAIIISKVFDQAQRTAAGRGVHRLSRDASPEASGKDARRSPLGAWQASFAKMKKPFLNWTRRGCF